MDRYLKSTIESDALAQGKMAFISGPRQVGKTTLGTSLVTLEASRFNWDDEKFKLAWSRSAYESLSARSSKRILLDEIHKDRTWKAKLKGLYDVHHQELEFVVTGSARLDIFRKGGDSLLGRYFPYRLHPFSSNEVPNPPSPAQVFQKMTNLDFSTKARFSATDLLSLTTFPEPLLGASQSRARRWSRLRLERLVQEDVRDLRAVQDLQSLKLLVQLLPTKVGSPFSVNSLRENLSVAYATLRDWTKVLEALYVHFEVLPYSQKLSRMLIAEPKIYLFDGSQIPTKGSQLENLVALHLLKAAHFWTDSAQGEFSLHYLRNKEKKEVDFCLVQDGLPKVLIECKSGETQIAEALISFSKLLKTTLNFQLVDIPGYCRHYPQLNTTVVAYDLFLSLFP
jgi:uncharacterized protein